MLKSLLRITVALLIFMYSLPLLALCMYHMGYHIEAKALLLCLLNLPTLLG